MPPTASSSLLSHPSPSPSSFIASFLLPHSPFPLVIYSFPPFLHPPLSLPLSLLVALFIASFPSLLPPSSSPVPVVLSPFNPSGERPSSPLLYTIIPLLSSSPPLPSSSCSLLLLIYGGHLTSTSFPFALLLPPYLSLSLCLCLSVSLSLFFFVFLILFGILHFLISRGSDVCKYPSLLSPISSPPNPPFVPPSVPPFASSPSLSPFFPSLPSLLLPPVVRYPSVPLLTYR